jgi:acetylornithine deacetylase
MIRDAVDRHRARYVEFLQGLVTRSASGEEATQQLVADRLRQLGCQVELASYQPQDVEVEHEFAASEAMDTSERVCVVGRFAGRGGGRSVMFFAHPDGEEVTGTDRWQRDPFAGVIEHGRLYGWAVADDLLGVATMASALDAVLEAGSAPKGDVILCSTPSKRNARGVVYVLNRGYSADAAVYLHPAESGEGLGEIKAFASGLLRFRITVPGRLPDTKETGHTAFYHLAVDPIQKAWRVYQGLQELAEQRAREVFHARLDEAIGRSTNLQVAYIHCGDEKRLSRVSPECVLAGSVTFPPGEDVGQVQSQILDTVRTVSEQDDWLRAHRPRVEWILGIGGAEVPEDHPLYRTVSEAVTRVTGREPHVNVLHSASDIRNPILHKGIPTVGLGSLAGDLSQTGGHDEWVDIADYIRAIEAVALVVLDWCQA